MRVLACLPRWLALLVACWSLVPASAAAAAGPVVRPAEGARLNYTHVPFRWPPLDDVTGYALQVVEDDGRVDPFRGAKPASEVTRDAAEPRLVVTSGIGFGKSYAWRVRGLGAKSAGWGPVRRFGTLPLPSLIPKFKVTTPAATQTQPRLTVFGQAGFVAVDATATPVWFYQRGPDHDIRMLPSGRFSFIGGKMPESTGRVFEVTLDGRVLWSSPDTRDLDVHHEAFAMPSGNYLALVREYRQVTRRGRPERWKGDRIVEFDRRGRGVVWSWSSFDHFSTFDYDEQEMAKPDTDGAYDWTHANAVVYDAASQSVYLTVRHLSRVTRIDYKTGKIVFNLGRALPSGDTRMGDGLFSFPHSGKLLKNGNLLVYDNGNRPKQPGAAPVSRAVEIRLSGGTPPSQAAVVWEYRVPEYNPEAGDADRLPNGNTLVTSGAPERQRGVAAAPAADAARRERLDNMRALGYVGADRPSDGGRIPRIYEVDAAGRPAWALEVVPPSLGMIYRAERLPRLVVDTPGDSDGDWDVDAADFEAFRACFGRRKPGFPCSLADLERDGDVDCADWRRFQHEWTESAAAPALSACAGQEPPARAPGQ